MALVVFLIYAYDADAAAKRPIAAALLEELWGNACEVISTQITTAAKAGAQRLVTEDRNAGQVIAGVRIENPFLCA